MKQRPILFSTAMVQALLDGIKTQTRRKVNFGKYAPWVPECAEDKWDVKGMTILDGNGKEHGTLKCPYGQVGDILWVRETWCMSEGKYHYAASVCSPKYDKPDTGWKPSIHMPKAACRLFLQIKSVRLERLQDISEADSLAEGVGRIQVTRACSGGETELRYQDYMQRHGQDINHPLHRWAHTAKTSYKGLWSKINGPDSWESNPFVWVVEFERIEKPSI